MTEVANSPPSRPPSLAARLVLLPFHLFGLLCGSLLLSITIECVGVAFFWPEQGWRHAREMLEYEQGQLSEDFRQSLLAREPGRTARELTGRAYELLFVRSGLQDGMREASRRASAGAERRESVTFVSIWGKPTVMRRRIWSRQPIPRWSSSCACWCSRSRFRFLRWRPSPDWSMVWCAATRAASGRAMSRDSFIIGRGQASCRWRACRRCSISRCR